MSKINFELANISKNLGSNFYGFTGYIKPCLSFVFVKHLTCNNTNSEDPDEMLHFIRVYTVCKGKKDLQTKENNIFANYDLTPLSMYNGLSLCYIKPEGKIH